MGHRSADVARADPNAFICQHCHELAFPAQACPGRDDPGGPCEPPPHPEWTKGVRAGMALALGMAEAKSDRITSANGKRALEGLAADLRRELGEARGA